MTNRLVPIALAVLALIAVTIAGASVAAQQAYRQVAQQEPQPQAVTVGETVYEFAADEPPVGFCVVTRTVVYGQQESILKVLVTGWSWTKVGGRFVVGAELREPTDVTDLPGWNTAEPDDCDSPTFGGNDAEGETEN